jgi:hypothetical protein
VEALFGEEISVMRNGGGAVHLAAVGNKKFIVGTADGARKDYKRKYEPTMNQAINLAIADGAVVFAAHVGERPNFFHRLFLRRDFWRFCDFENFQISAFQAINGNFDKSWHIARRLWIDLLLCGKRIPIVAGNDSHGDFNRYRAMSVPFVFVEENFERHFAKSRTGIYGNLQLSEAINYGRTFITTGAFIDIQADEKSVISNEVFDGKTALKLVIKSSNEFGKIKRIKLFIGDCKIKKENCVLVNLSNEKYYYRQEISQSLLKNCDYLRAETTCENNRGETFAATSAVYLKRQLLNDARFIV